MIAIWAMTSALIFALMRKKVEFAPLTQRPDFGARHLCRFIIQLNQGVEVG